MKQDDGQNEKPKKSEIFFGVLLLLLSLALSALYFLGGILMLAAVALGIVALWNWDGQFALYALYFWLAAVGLGVTLRLLRVATR